MTCHRSRPSPLRRAITRYVDLKMALGRRFDGEHRVLQSLDEFLQASAGRSADLTPESFFRWTQTLRHLAPTVRRNRLRIVRNLCLYRRRTEPDCFVPDPVLFPHCHQPRPPYIFTHAEIARLLRATGTLDRTPGSPLRPEVFRLWNGYSGGRPYTGTGFTHSFRLLLRAAKIRTPDGRPPRIHDVRHVFAVHALLRWYRAGGDVQTKLPLLATYMGHVSIVSTHYYLSFVEPLRTAASARFARHCGALVAVHSSGRGQGQRP